MDADEIGRCAGYSEAFGNIVALPNSPNIEA
jgi:hypothetical protein